MKESNFYQSHVLATKAKIINVINLIVGFYESENKFIEPAIYFQEDFFTKKEGGLKIRKLLVDKFETTCGQTKKYDDLPILRLAVICDKLDSYHQNYLSKKYNNE